MIATGHKKLIHVHYGDIEKILTFDKKEEKKEWVFFIENRHEGQNLNVTALRMC